MNEVRSKNFPLAYPDDVIDVISNLSMTDLKGISVMGSMGIRSQQYAGDYDLVEDVKGNYKTDELAINAYISKFQKIIKHFLHREDCYIGDIKSGEIPEWRVVPETMKSYSYSRSYNVLKTLLEKGVITDDEFSEAKSYLKEKPTKESFIIMKKNIKFHIVRWKPKEILAGRKTLFDGRTYTLKEAFTSDSLTKLDVIALVQNNRFTDFSCIYLFENKGKALNNPEKQINGVKDDIIYYKAEGKWFKVAKRIFSLSKYNKQYDKIEKLNTILNSDLGRLYSIISDANTILYILENESDIPIEKIRYEIDQFRARLSNIYTLNSYIRREDSILHKILDMKNLPNIPSGRTKLKAQMEALVEYFQNLLDTKSKEALQKLNLI